MNNYLISDLLDATMEKVRQMVHANTIVGQPIETSDGTTLIPISKISLGFGSGGSDYISRNAKGDTPVCFGGGGGAGVTVSPVAFIVVHEGNARVLSVNAPANTTADRLVEMLPEVLNRISAAVEKHSKGKAQNDAATDAATEQPLE